MDPFPRQQRLADHAITSAMFRRRLAGYKELGYAVEMPQIEVSPWFEDQPGESGRTK
jgi:hypothetical protein